MTMKLSLEAMSKKFTTDGEINWGEMTKAVLGQVDTHTEATTTSAISSAKSEVEKAIFEELGIKGVTNVTGLKSHLDKNGGTVDEIKTENTKLQNDLADALKGKTELETKFADVNGKFTDLSYKDTLKGMKIKPEGLDHALKMIKANVSDTSSFEDEAKAFKENTFNSAYFDGEITPPQPPQNKPGFGAQQGGLPPSTDQDQFMAQFNAGIGVK